MDVDVSDEIVADFLVEGGEILARLDAQLVALETSPGDREVLDDIFRGYHTIKGGAGFVGAEAMVKLCHHAEDIFNLLRDGRRPVDAPLMDCVLAAQDRLRAMFATLQGGTMPEPAESDLLARLEVFANPDEPAPPKPKRARRAPSATKPRSRSKAKTKPGAKPRAGSRAAAGGGGNARSAGAAEVHSEQESISDDEFDALLDALHGAGAAPGAPPAAPEAGSTPAEDAPGPGPDVPEATGPKSEGPTAAEEKPVAAGAATVRVATRVLDTLMNLVGELVLARNRIASVDTRLKDEELSRLSTQLDTVTVELQNAVMRTRMQPIGKVFGRFPRIVRDLARQLGKEVTLELRGEETELDKNLVEALADPMVHLVRNAIDHGIETPAERSAAGKPRVGRVVLGARQEGDHILLTVSDDGAGMDPDQLRRKAVARGLVDARKADELDADACLQLIFSPGFSTRTEVSEVSGRGVGMDVVKNAIARLNGRVDLESKPGAGARILIRVPLTLAIMPTLMVGIRDQVFALPLVGVREILTFDPRTLHEVEGRHLVLIRGEAMPLHFLDAWLAAGGEEATDREPAPERHVVVVHIGARQAAFVVDRLLGQEEVVIKPLGLLLQGLSGLAGATITGEGRVALILDLAGLVATHAR